MMLGRVRQQTRTGTLYSALVAQARQPGFYSALAVPDTVEGRFEMVALHCALALRRLRAIGGRPAAALSQQLLEYMFGDLDRSIREIGVGDMSVGKYMKRLGKSFYGRAAAYDAALDAGDGAVLAQAIDRNILGTAAGQEPALRHAAEILALYVMKADTALAQQPIAAFHEGTLVFPLPDLELP